MRARNEFRVALGSKLTIEAWPARSMLALVVAVHTVLWTLAPAVSHRSVPLDVAEGYGWGREWVIATYKHPALPAWFLEASRLLTGETGWPAYLVSQAFVAATFGFVYLLGRELLDERRAVAGVLLLSGIVFYAWPTVEFNHNIAQTLFWAALPYLLWQAVEKRDSRWWILFGAVAGASLYAKLSSALFLLVLVLWIGIDGKARATLGTMRPWLAPIIATVIALPLALWLVQNDFALIGYAASRAALAGSSPLAFMGSVVLNTGGLVVLLAVTGIWRPGARSGEMRRQSGLRREMKFVAILTAGPLGLAMVGAAVSGTGLRTAWSSAMFNFAGLLAVGLLAKAVSNAQVRQLARICLGISIALPAAYAAIVLVGPYQRGVPMRVNWPQAEISRRFVEIWERETGAQLRLVGGGNWVADLVAMTAPAAPSIFTGRAPHDSPWVTDERIARDGVLFVWHATRSETPALVRPYLGSIAIREERFDARRWVKGDELVIRYAIVPPRQGSQ